MFYARLQGRSPCSRARVDDQHVFTCYFMYIIFFLDYVPAPLVLALESFSSDLPRYGYMMLLHGIVTIYCLDIHVPTLDSNISSQIVSS